jgi:acyl-CoA reductase-like NAD-dependent aldehyde dehydrogenase
MTTSLEPELGTYRWSSQDEADRFPVEDPATGEVITLVQGGGTVEVNAAVEAAHRAFQTDWRWRAPAERAAFLLKAADVLAEHADELALLESRENGKPVADARSNDINFLIGIFRFFGSLVDKLPTDFYDKGPIYTSTYLEPVGVVGEIIPFNWPPIHAGGIAENSLGTPTRRASRRSYRLSWPAILLAVAWLSSPAGVLPARLPHCRL